MGSWASRWYDYEMMLHVWTTLLLVKSMALRWSARRIGRDLGPILMPPMASNRLGSAICHPDMFAATSPQATQPKNRWEEIRAANARSVGYVSSWTLFDNVMNGIDYPTQHHHRVTTHHRLEWMIEQQSKPSLTLFWRPKEGEDSHRTLAILYDANAPIRHLFQ